jgi:hypothetical protein
MYYQPTYIPNANNWNEEGMNNWDNTEINRQQNTDNRQEKMQSVEVPNKSKAKVLSNDKVNNND